MAATGIDVPGLNSESQKSSHSSESIDSSNASSSGSKKSSLFKDMLSKTKSSSGIGGLASGAMGLV